MTITRERIEEYLEALYKLREEGKQAKTTEIASRLKVSAASVTEMLKKLADSGYVKHESYRGVTLTEKGLKAAGKITRKHRLLERFLHDILNIRGRDVHEQACKMEHALSEDAEKALCRLLSNPQNCPDDNKAIPPCDRPFADCEKCIGQEIMPLMDLRVGQKGIVALIRGGRGMIQRLTDMGLTPGTEIRILKSAPFHGPIEICVRGSNLAIGRGVAMKIFVEAKK